MKLNMRIPKPAAKTVKAGGIELTADKTGDVRPKPAPEFSKDEGVLTPLPVSTLVDLAFPVKAAGTYSTDKVFDAMVAGLGKSLTSMAGTEWQSRLLEVADRIRSDPDVITTMSDEAVRTVMLGIEATGMTDVSRQQAKVAKTGKLDSATLKLTSELDDSMSALGVDIDMSMSFDFDLE